MAHLIVYPIPRHSVPYHTPPYCILSIPLLFITILHPTLSYSTPPNCMLYHTVLYTTTPHPTVHYHIPPCCSWCSLVGLPYRTVYSLRLHDINYNLLSYSCHTLFVPYSGTCIGLL